MIIQKLTKLIFLLITAPVLMSCSTLSGGGVVLGSAWSPAWLMQVSEEDKRNYFKSYTDRSLCSEYVSAYRGRKRDETKRQYIRLEFESRNSSHFSCDNLGMDGVNRFNDAQSKKIKKLERENKKLKDEVDELEMTKSKRRYECITSQKLWIGDTCR